MMSRVSHALHLIFVVTRTTCTEYDLHNMCSIILCRSTSQGVLKTRCSFVLMGAQGLRVPRSRQE